MDISVDLSNASAGTARFPVRLTPSVAALVTSPPLVTLTIEDVVHKQFQIDVRGLKSLSDDAFSAKLEPSAHNATISGPAKIVQKIRSVRAYADLSSINPSKAQPIEDRPLIAIDDAGHEVSKYIVITPSTITITPKITAASSSKVVLVSPIFEGVPQKGFVYNGYHVVPFQVTLIGDNLQLARTTEVKTERIEVNGLTATKTFRVYLHPLPGIAFQPSSVSVTYNVTPDTQFHVTPPAPTPSNTQAPTSTTGSNSSP
jgi:YbbR domain-containing protein